MNSVTIFIRVLRLSCLAFGLFATTTVPLSAQQMAQQPQPQQTQNNQQQAPAENVELSADEIIQILRENPDVLADAKAEIVSELRNRGYPITERELSDDRLFSQIRSDERARQLMSDQLISRGFGGAGEAPKQAQPQAPVNNRPSTPSNAPANGNQPARESRRAAGQSEYPLRNLPAVKDLYTQALNSPVTLERFGAALFRNSVATAEKSPEKATSDVPIGPDYVIGPGDELVVEYWGRTTQRLSLNVDREGRIVLPEAGGLVVAGRTLGDAQQIIQKLLTRQLKDITVDVTLGKLRTVRVYVVGDVKNPGAYDISSLSTALSALIAAGGPTDTGSYRLLKHFRGKRLVDEIDLYELMLHGVTSSQSHIESGDSILVPPVGAQVTVSGSVRRPAIYELHTEQTLDQVLDLAGGVPVSGQLNNVRVERIEAHQRKEMLSVNLPQNGSVAALQDAIKNVQVKDGDVITVAPILPYTNQAVYLLGHVSRPGKYPFQDGLKVTDVITSFNDLLPEAADRAEIVRLNGQELSPTVIAFNLRQVMDKKVAAPALQPFDTIRIYGRYDADAPKVAIYGEVMRPGEYPMSDRMSAVDLVRVAGGFKRGAFLDSADLSSYSLVNGAKVDLDHRTVAIARALAGEPDTDVILKPGDVLTIGQIGGWLDIGAAVAVAGEVLHPGRYGIQQGERLSAVLKRAGGFSADAYPYGAVLERAQVREFSAKHRDELISHLQEQTGGATGRTSTSAASPTSNQSRQLIDQLKQIQPSGRLLIHITTDIAKWENTPVDVEVRNGDSLIVPKRPNFVLVAGQVYNSAAITFSQGKHAGWYLHLAGGPTSMANKKDIFVIRANGTVVGKGSGEWWSGSVLDALLQPGDTIYVPDKVGGGGLLKNAGQYVQIISGVAVAASVIRTF